MQQQMEGKKVQNWHRPFHPSALSQRYLRLREEENLEECLSDSDEPYEYDDGDCGCGERCREFPASQKDPYAGYKLNVALARILEPMNQFMRQAEVGTTEAFSSSKPGTPIFENAHADSTPLEKRLAEHLERSLNRGASVDALRARLLESIGDLRNLDVIRQEAERLQCPGLARFILLFSPFWVRSPMAWKPQSGLSLLDHLFVLHEVPAFLYAEWHRQAESNVPEFKWLCWFILLAQGGSLKREAARFNWNIPNRFPHYLQNLPADLSATKACVYAEVLRMGGNETDFERLCSYETFVVDPTAGFAHNSGSVFWNEPASVDINFWRETVRWLIANRAEITERNSFQILAWALHEYTEAQRRSPKGVFSWSGRSARAAIRRSVHYYNRLKDPTENYTWQGHGLDWTWESSTTGKWSFVELTSSEELFWEGRVMQHCVYTYGHLCASGDSAIISVSRNDVPCLTIEIDLDTKKPDQMKGPLNRQPHPEERQAVNLWMSEVVGLQASRARELKDCQEGVGQV